MSQEAEFVPGLFVKATPENAPDYVIAKIGLKVADLGPFLREQYKAGNEWVNAEIKRSREGKLYAVLDTFKPKKKAAAEKPAPQERRQPATPTGGKFDDMDDSIPF